MEQHIESIFIFALVWSVGGTVDAAGRSRLDAFLRTELIASGTKTPFPEAGIVYDYAWDMENSCWQTWMETIPGYAHDSKVEFSELVIPTKDSIRNTFLLRSLLTNGSHVLMVGGTGTGKTVNINKYLQKGKS